MLKKVIIFILFCTFSFLRAETPILIIHSYHESYPWADNQNRVFRNVLDADKTFYPLYSTEYLDSKRRGFDKEYEEELVHFMYTKYKGYMPKIIYVTDDNAFNFMLSNQKKLFPNVPIVFSGVNDISKKNLIHDKRFSGVFEKKGFLENIELVKTLFPNEKEMLFLSDDSSTARIVQDEMTNIKNKTHNLNIQTISGEDYESTLNKLKNYKGKIILLATIGGFKTQEGRLVPLKQVIKEIINIGNFTVLALEDTYIQQGVIGGFVNTGVFQGEKAGEIALKILKNPEKSLPGSVDSLYNLIFDNKALEDYGVTIPKAIAQKSDFLNPDLSFIKKYEQYIIFSMYGLISIMILGGFFFTKYLYSSRQKILQREEALEEMTHSMNKAQSVAHLGHWDWNVKKNTLWWSDEVYRIFGYEPQEFKATYEAFIERIHPDDVNKVQATINETLNQNIDYHIVHRMVRKDGEERHVIEEGTLKLDNHGKPLSMIGIVHDITEEYQKEMDLLLQAEIFNAVQDSIMVHDVDGRFIYLNENAWKSRGYSEEEMMKLSVKELDAPQYRNDPKRMEDAFNKMQEDGHIRFQVEHLCKNGDRIPVEVYSKIITLKEKTYFLSSVRDITDQKKSQEIITASEKKYKDLVENAMVGIYSTNLAGEILYVNPAMVKMLNCDTIDEIIGENSLRMYTSPKEREAFIEEVLKRGSVNNYQLEAHDKYDVAFPVMLSAVLEGDTLTGMMIDMSEIKKSQAVVEKLSKAIEQVDDSVIITDKTGIITYVNQAFCVHTGYSKADVLGKTPRILKSSHHEKSFYENLWTTILQGDVFRGVILNKKKNGDIYYEKKTITPLKDDMSNLIGFVSTGKDVTSETMMHQELEKIAATDKLTGAFNRHKFEELFTLEVERSRRFDNPLSLVMIDIDHFKDVNDTYGHDVGDEVLRQLAKLVKEHIRNLDVFARWGGEEFLVLTPNTDLNKVRVLAEKLREAIETSDFPTVKNITISAGVSVLEDNDSFDTLLKRADKALYNSKNNGRNQVSTC